MSKFIPHTRLRKEVLDLFLEAQNEITIVTPYIKLSIELKKILEEKKLIKDFKIQVLFGKNENDPSKSLSFEDLNFLKGFCNLDVFYQENLHAKYYANEDKSIITSLNLHEFSLKNNIEVGVLLERKFLSIMGDNAMDSEVFDYFDLIFSKSEPVFRQNKEKRKNMLGMSISSEFKIIVDYTNDYYPTKMLEKIIDVGFCIRTGEKIPFNLERPFSPEAFKSWNQYKNKDFKEKYCHYSGELSNGQTTFSKPILVKYWAKAMSRK
jgi:hypothetical protein